MKMHRAEEIWLIVGVAILVLSMVFTGYQAFAQGMAPPSNTETLDPQKVDEHAPFDNPGVFEIGENEYEVVMTLQHLVLLQMKLKYRRVLKFILR